jgi:predicted small secreted protein
VRILALVALALVVSGCGGTYAGLSKDEASERAARALQVAQADGTLTRQLGRAIEQTATGAMGRAGSATLGSKPRVTGERALARGATPAGDDAWVAAYGTAGLGSAIRICVYVWDGGSDVDVGERC